MKEVIVMSQASILVIEDDKELNDAYKIVFETAGHAVKTTRGAEEALKYLEIAEEPSIIFLDLKMQGMDGIEFLKQYNAPSHPNTTVILFSNYDNQKEVDEAFVLGAERYILKARATPSELIRIVKNIQNNKATD
jgi:CheY-like chemotaxis protein